MRLAPTRLVPFSYFCTCWKVRPRASPSFSWLMPSMMRRMRTRLPTYLSTGFGALVDISNTPRDYAGMRQNNFAVCLRRQCRQILLGGSVGRRTMGAMVQLNLFSTTGTECEGQRRSVNPRMSAGRDFGRSTQICTVGRQDARLATRRRITKTKPRITMIAAGMSPARAYIVGAMADDIRTRRRHSCCDHRYPGLCFRDSAARRQTRILTPNCAYLGAAAEIPAGGHPRVDRPALSFAFCPGSRKQIQLHHCSHCPPSDRPSEQDLTALPPEAYCKIVLPHPCVIPRSVGDVDQSAEPC